MGAQRAPGQQPGEHLKASALSTPHRTDDQWMQGAEDVDRLGSEGQHIVDRPGVECAQRLLQ